MRKSLKTIAAASTLIVGLTTASALYAQQGPSGMTGGNPGGTMGMMGGTPGGMMGGGSMMGQGPGGMTGMTNMMGQMDPAAQNWMTSMWNWMTSMMTNHGLAPNQQGTPEAQPVPPGGNDQGE